MRTLGIYEMIQAERARQDALFGEVNKMNSTEKWVTILLEEVGEVAKAVLDKRFNDYQEGNYREELVQVAAVAVAMIESFDRAQQ